MNRLRSLSVLVGLALAVTAAAPVFAQADEPPFGLKPGSFSTGISTNQAGAHPDLRTRFEFNEYEGNTASGSIKDLQIVLPKGLLGAPTATPTCPLAVVVKFTFDPSEECPAAAAVGIGTVTVASPGGGHLTQRKLIYNIPPYPGEPAAFALNPVYPVRIDTYVRADGDYGVTAEAPNLTEAGSAVSADITLWGVPADHHGPGPEAIQFGGPTLGGPSDEPRVPFLTNPSECSGTPLTSTFSADSWQNPGVFTAPETYSLGAITGCEKPEFAPTIEAKPTTDLADAPSGLDFKLHLPQHNGPFTGADEVQLLEVGAVLGQFRLGFGGDSTGDLPLAPSIEELQSALEAVPSIGAGNIAVDRGSSGNGVPLPNYSVTFQGDLAKTDLAQIVVENGTEPPIGPITLTTLRDGVPGSPGEEIATAQLKDAVVRFPPGLTVNPSSANGLEACSQAQVGISASGQSNGKAVNCPLASKLGTVEAVSPAIDHPLGGALYLAAQNDNPFGSLLATYLVVEDLKSGINVKLAGKVEPDPDTGQLTVSFENNPQLPIEDINLHLFEGNRAALKTPASCGTHTTTSTLTPWTSPAGADATPSSSFALTKGPDGGACLPDGAGAPNNPTFTAGTISPTAKAFSPFVLKLTRQDGSQPFKAIEATLPKGLLAKLAGTPYCPDATLASAANQSGKAEQASPSCPAASQVGSVDVGAGAGSDPFYATGKAYLAGPYKGAPLSLAIVTPAVAGPFDLGTVVVRNALTIDPVTAQAHAVSDPIPTILQGIPLDVRSITVTLDRPEFTLNPTNCEPLSIQGAATSVFDQAVSFTEPFQVGDCARLGFKPSLKIKLEGGTRRSDHPALTAVLEARKGDANIGRVSVALPRSEFLAQEHIRTVCTRVQFNSGAGNGAGCPKGSIYGKASAITPLLDEPLRGPVYLRSSDNPLPDLVVALHGQVDFNLVGRIDSKNGGIRTSFESVPDAPVTKFVLQMQGGRKGLLANSRNLCRTTNKATVTYSAQNGDGYSATPVLGNSCGGKKKKAKKKGSNK